MDNNLKVIAIDGPSASGKSTVAKLISQKLGLVYIDTGAMFRGLGYILTQLEVDFSQDVLQAQEENEVKSYLKTLKFEYGVSDSILLRINDEDLTQKIRKHEVSKLASLVSKHPVVREYLKKIQREIALKRPSLLDGRDIGTIIFPDAPLKFFITASARTRAQRRFNQLVEQDSQNRELFSVEKIEEDIKARDELDMNRPVVPLKQASDAILIDSSDMTLDEVLKVVENKILGLEIFKGLI